MNVGPVIGWDLGGAHLKAARLGAAGGVEGVVQIPCPLWQGMPHLYSALDQAVTRVGRAPLHAVTMTGEMVDLFPDRREGVTRLVASIRQRIADGTVWVYAGRAGFLDLEKAAAAAGSIASANWMASASLVADRVPGALLVDVGSTTTDLIPVHHGRVHVRGEDDPERLGAGELLYTGIVRTPVMALAPQVPFAGAWIPLMAEHFATAADVHRLCGSLPDGADQHPSADGGEKTVRASARRLARMIGRDVDSADADSWRALAEWLVRAQVRTIGDACDRVLSRGLLPVDAPIVGAGAGRFLAARIAAERGRPYLDFGFLLEAGEADRSRAADCAPAVAVAWLARRRAQASDRQPRS